ncbi:hypothetical protein H4582DRAFT_2085061 [Lactarius indigo]|nr:hypothetical protein H4582DRAFT_2085061 [Lactarius indigo]
MTSKGKQKAKQRKTHKFNMSTYKMHALGDYARCIRLFGPSDGYSTQTGELEHRRCKRFYPRVHKGKRHYKRGIAKHVYREHVIHNIGKDLNLDMSRPAKRRKLSKPDGKTGTMPKGLPQAPPQQRYQLPKRSQNVFMLDVFLRENRRDPAIKDFLPHLRDHLLARILHREYDGDDSPFSDSQRAEVQLRGRKLYQHKVLRINYTTYDLHCEQDSINPRTQPNIMVLRPDGPDPHPYWYARIIGIYHVMVDHPNLSDGARMDFLWVRWYGSDIDQTHKSGFKARRLHRIGFVEHTGDPEASPAFGFVDPYNVIRAVHLPPVYKEGKRADLLSHSMAQSESDDDVESIELEAVQDETQDRSQSPFGRDKEDNESHTSEDSTQEEDDLRMASGSQSGDSDSDEGEDNEELCDSDEGNQEDDNVDDEGSGNGTGDGDGDGDSGPEEGEYGQDEIDALGFVSF